MYVTVTLQYSIESVPGSFFTSLLHRTLHRQPLQEINMATSTRKPKKAANGYVLPADKLKQREAAFAIYRDLSIGRSMHKLEQLLKKEHPELAVSRSSLESWSRRHDWAARVKAHDDAIAKGRAQGVMVQPGATVGTDFDQIDALLRAANQALTRAMSARPANY
jgi:hypothetical protein